MKLTIIAILTLAAVPSAAQTTYATATYLKYKPGITSEAHKTQAEIAAKGAAAYLASGERSGYVHLVRVFPSSHEVGHDALFFYTRSSPPVLGAPPSGTFHKAIGMTDAEWQAKTRSTSDVVKQEIWRSTYGHGTIAKGDAVRLTMYDPPQDRSTEYGEYIQQYIAPIYGQLVKDGVMRGSHSWVLMLTPGVAPYNAINLNSFAKGDGPLTPFPPIDKVFAAALPGKSLTRYRDLNRELSRPVGSVVYRVESAIWK